MSSYHSSFSYLNKNSKDNFNWLIVHFEADQGEVDSYMSQEQIFAAMYNGKRRLLYGTKYNSTANIKITVIKQNQSDFSVAECRDAYRWLTGNPMASWLKLYAGDKLQYEFLCTVQDVKPQKLDARTVGLNIYFESVSPWAYSPLQTIKCAFGQGLLVTDDGILTKGDDALLNITSQGILYNGTDGGAGLFQFENNGTIYVDNATRLQIDNKSDDLYTYISLNTTFTNNSSDYLSIKNTTLNEETLITGISTNETIRFDSEQFIISDIPNKIFSNNFNFVWPRLAPGINEFVISGTGSGQIEFTYRYPIKIGDCAIDVYVPNDDSCGCPDNTEYGTIAWSDIVGTPDTLSGYGITDAYTIIEVDNKIENVEITEKELNNMLNDVLGE